MDEGWCGTNDIRALCAGAIIIILSPVIALCICGYYIKCKITNKVCI